MSELLGLHATPITDPTFGFCGAWLHSSAVTSTTFISTSIGQGLLAAVYSLHEINLYAYMDVFPFSLACLR